ncbi:MAG: MFS transporter [Sciscionella sp.]
MTESSRSAVTAPSMGTLDDTPRPARSRARWGLLMALFAITAINYLDRTNMAVAIPHIKADFHLSATEEGLILSAFAWSYAALQVPGGWLVDRIGPKLSFGVAMVGWSLCTAATMLARGFGVLLGLRLSLGVFEAPAFPANNRLVATWFPPAERARATSVYTAGEYIGLAIAVPALSWLAVRFGWQSIFVVTGIIGLIFSAVWFKRVYDSPRKSPRVSADELKHIHGGAAVGPTTAPARKKTSWADIGYLLRQRRLWGMYIGMFANSTVLYFFLTWFPSYLVSAKHLSVIKAGVFGSIPYIAALAGVLIGGYWSDRLLRRGKSKTFARKTPIVTGFVLACVIVAANYTSSIGLIITFMSAAFFAQGMTALGWTLVAEVAPRRLLGITGGMFNLFANLGGAIAPLVIGVIVDQTGSFAYGLVFIAVVVVIGLLAYLLLIDKVERLEG